MSYFHVQELKAVGSRDLMLTSVADLPQNRSRNRFGNVKPFDQSRVILTSSENDVIAIGGVAKGAANQASDYINASWVPVSIDLH